MTVTTIAEAYDQPLVLLVGDLHGNSNALMAAFNEASLMGCVAIIQLGDYGFGWSHQGSSGEYVDEFARLTGQMVEHTGIWFYWIDGNHENFDLLYAIPLDDEGHRPIAHGVTHLPRGSTLTIGNTTFLAFGGAYSVDSPHRVPGRSYWPQETVTDEDVAVAKAAGQVDIFLSHDAPFGAQLDHEWAWVGQAFGPDAIPRSLENQARVRQALDDCGATEAFHGHIHSTYVRTLDTGCVVRALSAEENRGSTFILAV